MPSDATADPMDLRITLRLPDETIREIDTIAKEQDVSRSEVVRDALALLLDGPSLAAIVAVRLARGPR